MQIWANPPHSEGDSDIRAQFFAQLASSLTEKDNKTSAATSGDYGDDDDVNDYDDGVYDNDEDDASSLTEKDKKPLQPLQVEFYINVYQWQKVPLLGPHFSTELFPVSASVIRSVNGDIKSESKSVTLAPRWVTIIDINNEGKNYQW